MREGWKYVSFEKSINKVKKQKSVKSKDYKEKGIYPIVSQESALISGYCDDESLLLGIVIQLLYLVIILKILSI